MQRRTTSFVCDYPRQHETMHETHAAADPLAPCCSTRSCSTVLRLLRKRVRLAVLRMSCRMHG
jgi:hypothetical protein